MDKTAEDVLYHRAGTMEGKIKIIKIDDKSMNKMGDFSTWNRDVWADLVNYLAVVDRVEPCKELKAVTEQGFVNAISNADDRLVRHSFVYFDDVDGSRMRSFSSAIYDKYMETIGEEAVYPTEDSIMTFRYSGQPGEEMYIILKGSVGIFITSAIGTLTQVATIKDGSFFGEMAIFDNLPRSASCVALEDTITVAVTKQNLQGFLATCPEIAMQMLENMSGRIRSLDDELYKNNRFVKNRHVPRFVMPIEYANGYVVKTPYQEPMFVNQYKQACPICGKVVTVTSLKRNILEEKSFDIEGYIWQNFDSAFTCGYTCCVGGLQRNRALLRVCSR